MKLDSFAILSALDARARRGTADDAAGDNREAMAVLFQYFGLGPVPDLPIVRQVGLTSLLFCVKGDWYEWTARYGYRQGHIGGSPPYAAMKIWHPR